MPWPNGPRDLAPRAWPSRKSRPTGLDTGSPSSSQPIAPKLIERLGAKEGDLLASPPTSPRSSTRCSASFA